MAKQIPSAQEPDDRTWPLKDSAALRIIDGLYRCRKFVWTNDQKIVASYGLTWSQLLVIEALRNAEPDYTLSPTDLAALTQSTSGGMAKMLGGLVKLGMISRVENAHDGRSSLVRLTPIGTETVERALNELARTNTEIFLNTLTQEECDALAESLAKLQDGLKRTFNDQ